MSERTCVEPKCCPVCGVATSYSYDIEEGETGLSAAWYRCGCGVIFQENFPAADCYDEKYAEDYIKMKEADVRQTHAARTYAPLIEELTYGRTMLDVGFATGRNMKFFEDRGWITFGIDVNPSIAGKGQFYKGDFSTYDFNIPLVNDQLKAIAGEAGKIERKFDLIWMSHVLEHFNDPIGVINKAKDLLTETGVLYIAVPDAEFINKMGVAGFPHWKKREHYTIWTEPALKREVERTGMKVVMSRRNFAQRFASWFDIQLIAQKNYF